MDDLALGGGGGGGAPGRPFALSSAEAAADGEVEIAQKPNCIREIGCAIFIDGEVAFGNFLLDFGTTDI